MAVVMKGIRVGLDFSTPGGIELLYEIAKTSD
jgi:hypothetical protein